MAMAAKIKPLLFWQKIPFRGYFYASVVLNVSTVLILLGIQNIIPPVAPLLYGRPEGAGQLVPSMWLIIAPLVSIFLSVLNTLLIKLVKDRFIQQILVISAFLISLLTTITVLKIVFLVGFF